MENIVKGLIYDFRQPGLKGRVISCDEEPRSFEARLELILPLHREGEVVALQDSLRHQTMRADLQLKSALSIIVEKNYFVNSIRPIRVLLPASSL